ncbi:MAG: DUF6030 family protein [Mesorhizobium sp.]
MRRDVTCDEPSAGRKGAIIPERRAWKPLLAGFLLAGLCLLEVMLLVEALSTDADQEVASVEADRGPPQPPSAPPGHVLGDEAVPGPWSDVVMPPSFMLASPVVSVAFGLPLPFWYDLRRHPEPLCEAIGSHDGAGSWAESELARGYWECYGEVAEVGSGYSLFSMLRGRDPEEVGELRLKLTIEDEAFAAEARLAFIGLARRVFGIVGLPAGSIGEAILDGGGRREERFAGARLIMSDEAGSGRSHNLIVLLPPAAPSFATVPFEFMPRLPGRVARPAWLP